MSLEARELPAEEWPKLDGTPLQVIWRSFDPAETTVIVVEHDGAIVGCWTLLKFWHVEGVWVAPEHQKRGGVARRLLSLMRTTMARRGVRAAMTGADSPDVRHLLETHLKATRLPDHYRWEP